MNGRQRLGLPVAHQRPLSHCRTTNASGNRRRHLGVTQINACPLQRRIGLQFGCPCLIVSLLTDRPVFYQHLITFSQSARGETGCLGTIQCRLIHRRVDLVELLACLYLTALLKQTLLNNAVDLGTHFRHPICLGAARQLGGHDKTLSLDGHHTDLGYGFRRVRRLLLSASAKQGHGGEQGDQSSASGFKRHGRGTSLGIRLTQSIRNGLFNDVEFYLHS